MWKLYYHGFETFSSDDGPWIEAPAWGVAGLAVLTEDTGYYRNTKDFYILPPWVTEPYGCDHWGLMDYLLQIQALDPDERLTSKTAGSLEMAGVKFGRTLDDGEWRRHLVWMSNDPDLPHKSARTRHERP